MKQKPTREELERDSKELRRRAILKMLKKEPLSTAKIASKLRANYWLTLDLLVDLKREGKIQKISKAKGTFWSLSIKLKGGKR